VSLVVSEVEFAVLTVLISVRVNDSAPSLGTHYRGWMCEEQRERKMSLKSRMKEVQLAEFMSFFFSFGLTLNPFQFFPLSLFSQITFASPPPTNTFNVWCWEGLSWSPARRELVDSEAEGNVQNEYRLHVFKLTHIHSLTDKNDTLLRKISKFRIIQVDKCRISVQR